MGEHIHPCRCVTPDAQSVFRGPLVWHDGGPGGASAGGEDNGNKIIRMDIRTFFFTGSSHRLFFECTLCVGCNPVSLLIADCALGVIPCTSGAIILKFCEKLVILIEFRYYEH